MIEFDTDDEFAKAAIRDMRRWKPHYYVVFAWWLDGLALRSWDLSGKYSHGLARGFWADTARRLAVRESTVRARYKAAMKYFEKRYRQRRDGK